MAVESVEAGVSRRPAPRVRRLDAPLRAVPVSWRIFLIVALNAVAMLALGGLVWGGAAVMEAEWEAVRQIEENDRLFTAVDSDVSRMQSLVHRYLHGPTEELLTEIGRRRESLIGRLQATRVPDPAMTEDIAQLTAAARRFFAGFDALREIITRTRRSYDIAVLKTGGEMAGLYAILDTAARDRNHLVLPALGKSREAFAEGLLAANAFYLTADADAGRRAERAFDAIGRSIPVMRDLATDDLQRSALDALGERGDLLLRGIAQLRAGAEEQARLVGKEIDGGQRAMAQIIDRLAAYGRQRDAEAQRRFDAVVRDVGWGIGIIGIGFLALSAAASWAIGQSIRRPLRDLMEAMGAIAGGDYGRPVHGTTVRDEIGAMARSVAVFKENAVVKRRMEQEREAQERRWRTMLETSPVGISIASAALQTRLYSNPKYDELFGITDHDDALDQDVGDSFVDTADIRRILAQFEEHGEVSGVEVRRRRLDGTEWWCLIDIRAIDWGGDPAYIVWHYDVTFRREAEEELRAAKDRAEQTLAELRAAQQSLIQAEKMASLGALVAGIAHEINTPVGITVTAASLLADETLRTAERFRAGALRKSDFQNYIEMAEEASQRILTNADRAAGLIQSFKQVAVDQTRDDRRVFELGQYAREVLTSLGPRLRQRGIAVTLDCPEPVEVDGYPGPVAQVLTNFVMNALMHGFPPDTPGRIDIRVRHLPDDTVELVFGDDGQGIPADVLPRIFDPFFTTNRSGGGTGLGLNIVYNLVQQKLRGQITVDSAPGRGTIFTLRFPRVL
ncbi:MAG TPA: ATP-binding protein [Azospirillum sp.]